MGFFQYPLYLTAARPLQVMISSDLSRMAAPCLADAPGETRVPQEAMWVTQAAEPLPLSQHCPSVSASCRRALTCSARCLSEEINGCLTTLVVIKTTCHFTQTLAFGYVTAPYVRNYISAFLHFLS